jgi:putative aldouronate transport system substrate-binding protein
MKKAILCALSLMLVLSLALAGCAPASPATPTDPGTPADPATPAEPAAPELDAAEVVMFVMGDEKPGFAPMLEEFNKLVKRDLNATLRVQWSGWADFTNTYSLALSSGESIDLMYAATWVNFYQQARKGAFKALDELGPQYAPKTWAQMTEGAKYQATIDGKVYAIPNGRDTYSAYGLIVRGDLMEKYGMTEDFHDFAGAEAYLDMIKANEPTMQPYGLYSGDNLMPDPYFYSKGLYGLSGSTNGIYYIDTNAATPKVFNICDWEGLPEYLEMMKRWYDKGFWTASSLSNPDNTMFEAGKSGGHIHNVDNWVSEAQKHPEWDIRYMELTNNINVLSSIQDAMTVPTASKNPERGLMLLEKLRTESEFYDLFTYGRPGVDSTINADGTVTALNPEDFPLDLCGWGFRTTQLTRDQAGLPERYQGYMDYIRGNIVPNKFRSYFMETDIIKNEFAAVQNVFTQYYKPLVVGYTDPVTGLEELKTQMKAAGDDVVVAELQKQIDNFVATYK